MLLDAYRRPGQVARPGGQGDQRPGARRLRLLIVIPSQASTEHHKSEPASVAAEYQRKSHLRTPAGIPMRCRITGSNREKNTPAHP